MAIPENKIFLKPPGTRAALCLIAGADAGQAHAEHGPGDAREFPQGRAGGGAQGVATEVGAVRQRRGTARFPDVLGACDRCRFF